MASRTEPSKHERYDGLSVLIVNDAPINRLVLRHLLETFGCVPHEADGGRPALTALRERRFDVVLLDIHMPEVGGIEVAQAIKAAEAGLNREARFVAVTGDTTIPFRELSDAGFAALVNKPVSLHAIGEQLSAASGR